ncbi:MAG TPA: AAA family ATPase [Devosia sp.]|nr:AAA family ATPase [Devosia sp.]
MTKHDPNMEGRATRPAGARWQTWAEMMQKDLPPVDYVAPGLVAVGLNVLFGGSKLGKSYLAQNIAIAVNCGGAVLDCHVGAPGDVLYMDFELGERRLVSRIQKAFPSAGNRPPLHRVIGTGPDDDLPKVGPDLFRFWDDWRARVERPRLIIVDVWQDIAPPPKASLNAYAADSAMLRPVHKYANQNGIAVLLLHHPKKGAIEDGDPLSMASGSTAMTSVPNNLLFMAKSTKTTTLYVRGHDIEERHLAIEMHDGIWSSLGDAAAVVVTEKKQLILDAIRAGHVTPLEISDETGQSRASVRQMLSRMDKAGKIGEAMGIGNGRYGIRGKAGADVTPSTKTPGNIGVSEIEPVTSAMSQQEKECHSVTEEAEEPVTGVTPVTSQDLGNITALSPSKIKENSAPVTFSGDFSSSLSETAVYLLRWLQGFGGKASHREAQQRCAPTLKGEEIKVAALELETSSLVSIEVTGTGKRKRQDYSITSEGKMALEALDRDPNQIDLFAQ